MQCEKTRGERYVFESGEEDTIAAIAKLLREAYDKIQEAETLSEDRWFINFHWDTDENGNPVVPTNYETEITIYASVDDSWLQSTQDC